jgi:hypothetical protein
LKESGGEESRLTVQGPIQAITFLKSPTSSFFFVSTEITGCCSASARVTLALMWANCASRSGWLSRSRVLTVGLQAELLLLQQFAHDRVADLVPA